MVIHEPTLTENSFDGNKVVNDFNTFKQVADFIMASRLSDELQDVKDKVYTMDIFSRD